MDEISTVTAKADRRRYERLVAAAVRAAQDADMTRTPEAKAEAARTLNAALAGREDGREVL